MSERTYYASLAEAETAAVKASRDNPKLYVTIGDCFGLYVYTAKSLAYDAAERAVGGCYYRAGKRREFTASQKAAATVIKNHSDKGGAWDTKADMRRDMRKFGRDPLRKRKARKPCK